MVSPKVSVVVVNWNGASVVGECLESLACQSLPPHEVIVVDNGSEDNSLEIIHSFSEKLPLVVIPTGENLGFAGANNIGIGVATGELVALLNNDAVADSHWIERMVEAMVRHEGCGIVASKLLVYGEDRIDSAGDGFSTALKGFKMVEGQPSSARNVEEEVMAACAGAALYSRSCLDDVGLFDNDFFLIWEDMDLSLRARWRGWRVVYAPNAVAHHRVRSSIKAESPLSVYYTVRNCGLVRVKNLPFSISARCLFPFLLGELAMFLYFCARQGRWGPYLKGKLHALGMLPGMMRKRRAVMEGRRCTEGEFYSLFTPALTREFMMAKLGKFLALERKRSSG